MNQKRPGILGEMEELIREVSEPQPAPQQHTPDTREREPEMERPKPVYGDEGEARRADAAFKEASTSPFPEQYCEFCNKASGHFASAKRKVSRDRDSSRNKSESRVLTESEMARVRDMIPEHIQHLDECPANNGGFD